MNILTSPIDTTPQLEHKPHILIVDDEPFNRTLLHRILSHQCQITEAEDGYVALEFIKQCQFDLVVLDIMMPGITGLDVLTEIRTHTSKAELPVILVTALDGNNDIVQGLKLGANDYMPKPIDTDVVLARVITQLQLKSAYDMQQQALVDMQQASVLKNTLFKIASHDLKSPLSSAYMAEQLLRKLTDQNDETIVTILDTLKMTVNNMNQIIVEFLDMAMLQSNEMKVDIAPTDVTEVIEAISCQYHLPATEKGSVINITHTEAVVLADVNRLHQCLSNLVSNALKYSPPNSEITLNIDNRYESIVIEVIDQGPGIPESEMNKLFTEFGKLSTRPTGQESSTGLGLWIVKQMVELMNGRVGVYCPDTGGSVFWIELPASSAVAA